MLKYSKFCFSLITFGFLLASFSLKAEWIMVDSVNVFPSWDKSTPYELRYMAIDCFDDQNFVAIANVAYQFPWIRTSSDEGKTWATNLYDSVLRDYPIRMGAVAYPDSNLCIIVGDSNYYWRSVDGCRTWDKKNLYGNHIYNNPLGYSIKLKNKKGAIVSALELFLTDNYGQDWINTSIPFPDSLFPCGFEDVSLPNDSTLICLIYDKNYARHVIYSDDWGNTWIFNDSTPKKVYKIYFVDESEGWACGGEQLSYGSPYHTNVILHTTNSGKSWVVQLDTGKPRIFGFKSISFADRLNGVVLGLNYNIWKTSDGGQTWIYDRTNNYKTLHWPLQDCKMLKNHDIIGVAEDDLIYKYVNEVSVNENFQSLIDESGIVFPNPAGDYINISVGANGCSPESIKIFDVFGQEEHPPTPSYEEGELRVDVSALPPGVYFMRVGSKVSKFIKY